MPTQENDHERSAAGMDYDSPLREKASKLGTAFGENGPEALLDEVENILPESWREHIAQFPIAAILLGLGVGIWLGMKKGDEVIAAGTSFVTSAAMSNVSQVMDHFGGSSNA
jgi:hypothetical protein